MQENGNPSRRRVVVTGLGVVAANASNVEEFTQSVRDGIKGIKPVEQFATQDYRNREAGVVCLGTSPDQDENNLLGRIESLAFKACREAISNSGIELEMASRQALNASDSIRPSRLFSSWSGDVPRQTTPASRLR